MTETEQIIVGLISSAGQSKSLAFEALKKVKTGEYDEARKRMVPTQGSTNLKRRL